MSGSSETHSNGSACNTVARQYEEYEPRVPLSDDEVVAAQPFKILAQFKSVKDIRISVKGEYWERLPELRGRRLEGTVVQWAKKDAPDRRLKVLWEDGHDIEHLDQLFHPDVDMQFLPFANGKPAPRLVGRAAAREEADRLQRDAEPRPETVTVEYVDGSQTKQQVWKVELPNAITVDQRKEDWSEPRLARELSEIRTPYKMWLNAALPLNLVTSMVELFNERLTNNKGDTYDRPTTVGEIIRFLSYMIALSVERGLPIDEMWSYSEKSKQLRPPPSFGDHEMSKDRCKRLRSLAGKLWHVADEPTRNRFSNRPTETDSAQDMWRWSRLPIDKFNEHYEQVFTPGSLTGPDETMCPWEGTVGDQPEHIPHSHFIPRKPKDTGLELNTQADGQSGGIYCIDIERGAEDECAREFEDEWGYTSALNFRLAKSILGSGRIFAGDSRFMSVDAVEDLHLKGLYAIGDVKTKSSRYPVNKIKELCGPNSGDWSVMSTELADGFKVYAIGHRRGGEVHTFIASCGVTMPGEPQKYKEDLLTYGSSKPRPCPKVLNLWSRQQPMIDRNNRYRQDILAIEERFVTTSFPFRLLTTVLGITVANAYEWYQYFVNNTMNT